MYPCQVRRPLSSLLWDPHCFLWSHICHFFHLQPIVQVESFPVAGWLTVSNAKLGLGISVSSSLWSLQYPPWQALIEYLPSEWKPAHNVLTARLWHLLSLIKHVSLLACCDSNCLFVREYKMEAYESERKNVLYTVHLNYDLKQVLLYQIIIRLITWQPLSLLLAGAIQLISSADIWLGAARHILPQEKSASQKNTQTPKHCTGHTHPICKSQQI